ncbi:MAG: hypothetical protein KKD44_28920, partial [Proteobacteria bacterium]|nr:hypothetical protein [Pseudomonadota bacterium]
KIPIVIEFIRNLIMTLIEKLGLPVESTYVILIGIIALVLSYLFIKQFITYNIFGKIFSLLNWLLIGILLYTVFVYI